MTKELTRYAQSTLDEKWRYAEYIGTAGALVPKGLWEGAAPSPGKILMVMEHATLLGLHPLVGVNDINIIEGKVSVPPSLMSSLVRQAGHKLRVTTTGTVEGGDFSATASLVRSDDAEYTFEAVWTPQRAERAGLCRYVKGEDGTWAVVARSQSGKALPWQSYTEAMCKARAISEVVMEGATDVMMGAVYTPEELGGLVDDVGVLKQDPEPTASSPTAHVETSSAQPAARVAPTAQNAPQGAPGRDWAAEIAAIESSTAARSFYTLARDAGALALEIEIDGEKIVVADAITKRGVALLDVETKAKSASSDEVVVDAEIIEDTDVIPGQQTIDDVLEGGE